MPSNTQSNILPPVRRSLSLASPPLYSAPGIDTIVVDDEYTVPVPGSCQQQLPCLHNRCDPRQAGQGLFRYRTECVRALHIKPLFRHFNLSASCRHKTRTQETMHRKCSKENTIPCNQSLSINAAPYIRGSTTHMRQRQQAGRTHRSREN